MASSSDEQRYVNEALDQLVKIDPEDYAKLTPGKVAELREDAKKTIDELLETVNNVKQKKGAKITIPEVFKHLSKERIDKITKSLENQTFFMSLGERDGVKQVTVLMKDGSEFQSPILLPSNEASALQSASIVVEAIILFLDIIGISLSPGKEALKAAVDIVVDAFGTVTSLFQDITDLETAYKESNYFDMAKAIASMVINLFTKGICLTIVKALVLNMTWWDWLITAIKVIAYLIALIATGTTSEIARVISLLVDAAEFITKLTNLAAFVTV